MYLSSKIPIINPKTGRGQARRLVSVVGIPRGARAMDDEVEVLVYLPAGSDLGPQVSDQLRQWGNRSAPAWRALINLAYLWFDPGQTHAPIGRGRHQHWQQIHDPGRYPVLSDKDLVDLCFPTSQNQRRISRDLLPRAIRILQSRRPRSCRSAEAKAAGRSCLRHRGPGPNWSDHGNPGQLRRKPRSTAAETPVNCGGNPGQLRRKPRSTAAETPVNCGGNPGQLRRKPRSTAAETPVNCGGNPGQLRRKPRSTCGGLNTNPRLPYPYPYKGGEGQVVGLPAGRPPPAPA